MGDEEIVAEYSELILVSKIMRSILYEVKNETFHGFQEYSTIGDVLERDELGPVRVFISHSLRGGSPWYGILTYTQTWMYLLLGFVSTFLSPASYIPLPHRQAIQISYSSMPSKYG